MKLCPQCDFIYEDDQLFCDMDGKELVHNSAPIATVQSAGRPTRITVNIPPKAQSRRSPALIVAGVALTLLLSVVYFAQLHPSQSSSTASAIHSSSGSIAPGSLQPSVSTAGLPAANLGAALPEQSPTSKENHDGSPASSTQSLTARAALAGDRLAANPVAARAISANGQGSVIVRLNNRSAIKADEAWETKQGVWYRQAGVVTLLKRSQVRTIERPGPPAKAVLKSVDEKSRRAEQPASRDRLRPARLEPPDTPKQSRVASFLKKTGRLLKRPFKF